MKITLLFVFLLTSFTSWSDAEHIETRRQMEETSIRYFIDHAHPQTGLVRDKAYNFQDSPAHNKMSSLAATGFGLTVIAHASMMGKVSPVFAKEYVRKTLRFTFDHVPHYRGWLTHFANWETGEALKGSEYSTIDTALLVAGALYAAQILKDPEIDDLTYKIYDRIDFYSGMTDDGKKPHKRTISLSYTPEKGWTSYQWNIYAEQKILLLLALGHPSRPLPKEVWTAWTRATMGIHMPLFIHQYSLVFYDFRNLSDGYKNYFEAGLNATFLQRNQRSLNNKSKTYAEGFWGLSAGEDTSGYNVYHLLNYAGTVCLGCAMGSAMYAPEVIVKDASIWKKGKYKERIWGRYGFVDSLNLDKNWVSPYVLGITVGPQYMSLNNMEGRTSIWKDFMKVPAMVRASRIIKKN